MSPSSSQAQDHRFIVRTTGGRLAGFEEDGSICFLGVPFAAPPVGPHRLAAPAPADPWDGVRPALTYGPTAQRPADEIPVGIPEPSIPGDDVLNLNVFTPDLHGANMPVLVWIHGGGFVAGCNASPWYRGTRFARDGVVLVSIGYRLGAEGFLPLAGAPNNRSVLDWIAALTWVQENIAGFGGDPTKVTVAGQSAGGTAATTLVAVPQADGLFRYVVAMSGVAATKPLADLEEHAAKIAAHLGVPPTRESVAALPPSALHDADHAVRPEGLERSMPYRPVVDGEVLLAKPLARIAEGAGASVNVLAGCTADEFNHPTVGRVITDTVFRSRVVALAEAHRGNTYVYEFRWGAPGVGAVHCTDIPFVFDNLDQRDVHPASPPELAATMHRAFVDFVTTGDPGWEPWETKRRNGMVFDTPSAEADDLYGDLSD